MKKGLKVILFFSKSFSLDDLSFPLSNRKAVAAGRGEVARMHLTSFPYAPFYPCGNFEASSHRRKGKNMKGQGNFINLIKPSLLYIIFPFRHPHNDWR